ncbi:Vacuolar protein sorting-associated protein 29 [Plasmodiophora brassicae]|uniref:Vacuolar protein sorting-associated protein 29 n=1 Tax=Plasmodiophora brassicae TaxID=37360 RepID=A0A0G4IMK0_PLABS|nr:hypothetical protein PBRA_005045 [Plasmodiophora brassicae]SPQ99314.1 unnamed protein product [Plasmodiophora brassicae]
MAQFGELVLVLGDMHIPMRTDKLPAQFKTLLVPGKMQHILCTGNLCSRQAFDHLKTIASSVHVARGDYDVDTDFPEHCTVKIGNFTIGVIHGHQVLPWGDSDALAQIQSQLGVDILISGHTHKQEVYELNGKYFVNPGSATGAYSPTEGEVVPSFVLMAIKDDKVVTYVYELRDGEVKVSKSEHVKSK